MKQFRQKIQIIQPGVSPLGNVGTFVFQELGDPQDNSVTENIFCILTIWAPEEDISDIYHHCTKLLVNNFQSKLNGNSVQIRYKSALSEVNHALRQLETYYDKKKYRFHIEGVVAAILPRQAWVSSCGESKLYLKRLGQCKMLFDKQELHKTNTFQQSVVINLSANDQLILTSSRFNDRVPKTILQRYMASKDSDFKKFRKEIASLQSSYLAAVSITTKTNQKPVTTNIASNDTPKPIEKSTLGKPIPTVIIKGIRSVTSFVAILTKPAQNMFKSLWNRLWSKHINSHPLLSAVVFILSITLIISCIVYFVVYNPRNQALQKKYNEFQKELIAIEAQSSTNKTLALQNLTKLRDSINSLPQNDRQAINDLESREKQSTLDDMLNKITSIEDTINNITRLSPTVVYSNPKEAKYTASTILGDSLYTVDTLNGEVLAINIKSSTTKIIATKPELKSAISMSVGIGNTLLASTKEGIYQITIDGVVSKQNNTSGEWPSNKAISTYTNNLYLLSPDNDQIYRFSKTLNGFGPKTNYIKSPTPEQLDNATDFVINGSVFVSLENGKILYFNQGVQKEFAIINPPADMQNIHSIDYLDNPDRLILLNSSKSAFIVLSLVEMGAKYEKEVIVNKTTDISSFVLSKNNNVVYFTTNNLVLKIAVF